MCVTIFHTTFYEQAAHRMLPMGVRSSGPPSIWPLGGQDNVENGERLHESIGCCYKGGCDLPLGVARC